MPTATEPHASQTVSSETRHLGYVPLMEAV